MDDPCLVHGSQGRADGQQDEAADVALGERGGHVLQVLVQILLGSLQDDEVVSVRLPEREELDDVGTSGLNGRVEVELSLRGSCCY